jgi:hypothetical protein
LNLPLDFLGHGGFQATMYVDAALDGRTPNELREEARNLDGATTLEVSLAPGGGVAAVFRPMHE